MQESTMRDRVGAALKSLAHRPALAAAVIATLTLGIGANSAIFSAVDAVLLKPLPYPAPDRLVSLYERNRGLARATQLVAPVRLDEWNAQNRTFVGLAGCYFENMTDTTGALPERVAAMRTSPRFFSVLDVGAAVGRTLAPSEERFGGAHSVVIGDRFWTTRFNRDPTAIGRALVLGGQAWTIVGVMPPSFRYPTATTEVWVPAQLPPAFSTLRLARFFTAVGRMKGGVTADEAERDLSAVQARLGDQFPQTDRGWAASVVPLKEERVAGVRRSLLLLLGAVGLVLLAACGNVACLLLADATRREHEIAVRFALGASRRTVVGQLLLEGSIMAAAGTACGLIVAYWSSAVFRQAMPTLPRIEEVHPDARLVAFTVGVGLGTTLLFALAPALQGTRLDPAEALARGGRGAVAGRHWLRQTLVTAQVALALVLVVGAGLLTRSFTQMQHVSLGLDPASVTTFRMSASWSESLAATVNRQARTVARLNAVPGVEAAAFSQQPPAGIDIPPAEFHIVGRSLEEKTFSIGRAVSGGYFRALHIPLLQGETCSDDPAEPAGSKVLVTRTFADRFFPGEDPLGHGITSPGLQGQPPARIVGIVGDVRESGALKEPQPTIYWCGFQPYFPDQHFIVRAAAVHPASMAEIRAALREIEPGRAVFDVKRLNDALSRSLSAQRTSTTLLALFAATALALAAMGLYGVLSQLVSSRRREIGVRVALGARPSQIVRAIAGPAAVLTVAGAAAGLAAAAALARFMSALVFGISPHDPLTFLAVPVVLGVVAAAAAIVPARRAARIDPMQALRE
jgi:putative ABC transport system permease protein